MLLSREFNRNSYTNDFARFADPGFAFPQSGFGPDFSNDFAVHQRMMEDHFKAIQAQIEAQQRA